MVKVMIFICQDFDCANTRKTEFSSDKSTISYCQDCSSEVFALELLGTF